jgi:hypothetical protein
VGSAPVGPRGFAERQPDEAHPDRHAASRAIGKDDLLRKRLDQSDPQAEALVLSNQQIVVGDGLLDPDAGIAHLGVHQLVAGHNRHTELPRVPSVGVQHDVVACFADRQGEVVDQLGLKARIRTELPEHRLLHTCHLTPRI